jgi:hypothetical protein
MADEGSELRRLAEEATHKTDPERLRDLVKRPE